MSFIYDMADTWNNGGTVFTAIKMTVTNTASAPGSRLIDLLIGATSIFNVDTDGQVTFRGSGQNNKLFPDSGSAGSGFIVFPGNSATANIALYTLGLKLGNTSMFVWGSGSGANSASDAGFSRMGANDVALGNGTLSDETGNLRIGSLKVNQVPTANTSAATTITNGADSSTNLGHRASFNMNGTTYWFPCGATAF
jgi:hypothetical protein